MAGPLRDATLLPGCLARPATLSLLPSLSGRPLFHLFYGPGGRGLCCPAPRSRPTAHLDRAHQPVRRSRPEPSVSPSISLILHFTILPWPSPLTHVWRARPGHLPVLDRALQPVGSCPCQVNCNFVFLLLHLCPPLATAFESRAHELRVGLFDELLRLLEVGNPGISKTPSPSLLSSLFCCWFVVRVACSFV